MTSETKYILMGTTVTDEGQYNTSSELHNVNANDVIISLAFYFADFVIDNGIDQAAALEAFKRVLDMKGFEDVWKDI